MSAAADSNSLPPAFLREPTSAREVLAWLWRDRWLLLCLAVVCGLVGGGVAWFLPKKYEAKTILLPVTSQSGAGILQSALGSAVSELGGLAALTGLSGSNGSGERAEAIATLQSDALTEDFIRNNNLLSVLFHERWDSSLNRWNTDNRKHVPTYWLGAKFFAQNVRKVEENNRTGLVTLTITWTDPQLAAQWANGLVRMTNDVLRDKAIKEAERNIAYLQKQASVTNAVELRQSIYTLMETSIRNEMIAKGRDDYSLRVIEPALVPERPVFPVLGLWALGGAAFGLVLGFLISALRPARNTAKLR